MNRDDRSTTLPARVMTDLEYAIDLILTGRQDAEFSERACRRMDQSREQMHQGIGEVEAAVEWIRAARDEGVSWMRGLEESHHGPPWSRGAGRVAPQVCRLKRSQALGRP